MLNVIKNTVIVIVTFIMLISLFLTSSYAGEDVVGNESTSETIYFEDGSYAVIETVVDEHVTRASKNKKASSTYTYYNSNKVKQWSLKLSASFSYNGSEAKATEATISRTVDHGWACSSKSATRSGATATGKGTFKKGEQQKSCSIKLTCSSTGKITVKKS